MDDKDPRLCSLLNTLPPISSDSSMDDKDYTADEAVHGLADVYVQIPLWTIRTLPKKAAKNTRLFL
jgi:hypothetical protein